MNPTIKYRIRWVKHHDTGEPLIFDSFYWQAISDINVAYQRQNFASKNWPAGECIVEEYA